MTDFQAIVLAGERTEGGALGRELDVPAPVLTAIAGKPSLYRVLECLCATRSVSGGVVSGPAARILEQLADNGAQQRITSYGYRWLEPAQSPALSALAAVTALQTFPLLITSADHALLTPATVDDFCHAAMNTDCARDADIVVGLVPYEIVQQAFPTSNRTLLRFADGILCGSNLFVVRHARAVEALRFWSEVERLRKQPRKIARRLGWFTLLRYLAGRLSVAQAMKRLSDLSGCRIRWVTVEDPRAAVDVDSAMDWRLAEQLLAQASNEASSTPAAPLAPTHPS